MKKYTKGPWHCEEVHQDNGRIQIATAEDFIAEVYRSNKEKANARLIASAPNYHEHAYNLAMLVLQSNLYKDYEVRQEVDSVIATWRQVEGR